MSEHQPPQQPQPSKARPAKEPRRAQATEIESLIQALDDPQDERYSYAEDELITLGPQAVPYLIQALDARQPWLRSYRAAEALGQIGDGRASRPLIAALRHPNSNVRWGVVRALAKVGDTRAYIPLRRLAASDRSKTSWGESVASAAKVALDDMSSRSAMIRMSEPVKIALLVALALFSIWFATDRVQAFREVVDEPTSTLWGTQVVPIIPTEVAESEETAELDEAAEETETTATPTLATDDASTPTPTPQAVTVRVVSAQANIRPQPNTNGSPIASVTQGTTLEVVSQQTGWYEVQLPNGTGTGWISASIVSQPSGPVPTEN